MNRTIRTLVLASASVFALGATTGCSVFRGQETVGAFVDDSTITTKVKAKFAEDPTVSAMAISVETMKGTVQLSGFAKSNAERMKAEELARGTSNVTSVRNDIIVRP